MDTVLNTLTRPPCLMAPFYRRDPRGAERRGPVSSVTEEKRAAGLLPPRALHRVSRGLQKVRVGIFPLSLRAIWKGQRPGHMADSPPSAHGCRGRGECLWVTLFQEPLNPGF